MILDKPALKLNIGVQDILDVLEGTLRERNWGNFEVASLKLVYTPYYVFNYDVLIQSESASQGFSGLMAINATTGKLEPSLAQIMEQQPVNYEKEPSHDIKFEIDTFAITDKELADTCKLKMAAELQVPKEAMGVSAFRPVYWPTWRIFVSLPRKTQRIDVEAVSGFPLNIQEVPVREKTWLEVTSETLGKLKSPSGIAEVGKAAVSRGAGAAASKGPTPGWRRRVALGRPCSPRPA
ncbi:hypothetical protein HYS54_03315, partial [Candidatus Micrarchaeota archaeon]|nr:hypothetical protein [Candidatus Micrarchaeota archaeon]